MADDAERPRAPAVFSIPTHRSFADALVAGLIERFGNRLLGLAQGRILLPNNRAVRTVSDAFVRASGGGLVLPRLVPIGDPELEERIGGMLDPADDDAPIAPAIEPLDRLVTLAGIVRSTGVSGAEALRLAGDLARTIDALLVEEVEPARLAEAAMDAPELAAHWQVSLARLQAIIEHWPAMLAERQRIDLAQRRNLLLRRTARRWRSDPPPGFTVAAGITTAAPAVAALLRAVSELPEGLVVLPGLSLPALLPEDQWEALGPDDDRRGEETHPQYHLKLLLERMGIARGEVRAWRSGGRSASPAARGRAVAHAMVAADHSDSWQRLSPRERRLTGVRTAELPDAAAEAQTIALALREAIETPGRTAALVTPDRMLAERVSALLQRWGIAADDSAGRALSQMAAGTLLLALVSAASERLAPVPLLALLKHPLVGGEGADRAAWLDTVRSLDLALRGPRPAGGLAGLDRHFEGKGRERGHGGVDERWRPVRAMLVPLDSLFAAPQPLDALAASLVEAATMLAGDAPWRGPDGHLAAELLGALQDLPGSAALPVAAEDSVGLLRLLLDQKAVRPPYGGHPRISIWGLLEARLQQADLMVLGGLNEGTWPALPAPDPWLAPRIRANLALPGLDFRIGLAAHDFASALGAPEVLVTRSRRDSRAPTVASRLLLRLQAMTGGLPRAVRLERLAVMLDEPALVAPAGRPAPAPPAAHRPKRVPVTAVDRLRADPFAFYAQQMLGLRSLDAVDADHSAAWKGTAVHKVFEQWLRDDDCDPDQLVARARALLADDSIHPMLRALWQPRLIEAVEWIAALERDNRAAGRRPLRAEEKGEATIAGITVYGRADRIDRLADGGLAIVDYKTGQPPKKGALEAGFALQLGLLGLIAREGGFNDVSGAPGAFEYWSLTRDRDGFGKMVRADKAVGPDAFLASAEAHFAAAAAAYLHGEEPFVAKLHPAYAPYGDYDQLMRLEEWYGRE